MPGLRALEDPGWGALCGGPTPPQLQRPGWAVHPTPQTWAPAARPDEGGHRQAVLRHRGLLIEEGPGERLSVH